MNKANTDSSINTDIIEKLQSVFDQAVERSKSAGGDIISENCAFNARALDTLLAEQEVPTRTIRGVVVREDDPYPDDVEIGIEEYIGSFGNGHWWVEAELTTDTWWTVDLWSLHPDRDGQRLVMAGRPDEYLPVEVNPEFMKMFDRW